MRKEKGFTLIELLAVLILISIITVISMPKIINVIEQSKIKAFEQSANGISDAAKFKQNSEFSKNGEFTSDYSFAGGNYTDESEKLPFKGDTPYSGMLHLNKNGETALAFAFKDNKKYYCITKNYNDKKSSGIKIKNGEDCSITLSEGLVLLAEIDDVEEFVQVEDPNPGIICGDEKKENYDNLSECHIKSVEDFAKLSSLVNSGKDFNGKTVILDNNIDFNNDLSYINPNSTNFGDFNEDGIVQNIKKEVTESYGFKPIGNYSKNFKGKFLGNNNKIKGIYINRTEQDYVGLFGLISGDIKNISIDSSNVIGKNYVGTIAGKLSGKNSNGFTVNNLKVSGVDSVGSIFGNATKISAVYADNVNVNGTRNIGGIIGNGGYSVYSDSIVMKNSTVTGTTYTKNISGGEYGSSRNYLLLNVKLNNEDVSNSTSKMLEDINGLEAAGIDTYVGGDNDKDGFYFDYNKKNKIVIKNVEDNPILGLTNGTGTKIDPYIISNEEDWKKATAMLTNTTYYFKLTKDLNFSNKKFYMFGSKSIPFKGILDGNNKKISSVTLDLEKSNDIGLSGYSSSGIIKNINIDKFIVKGNSYVGTITGEQQKDINSSITVTNSDVGGNSNVGGVYGAARAVSYVTADNINVNGTENVGVIVGNGGYTKYTSNVIIKNSSVAGTTYTKNISGGQYGSSKNYLLLNVKLNNEDVSNSTSDTINDINSYEAAGIDTFIGGDNDNTGYYFDYNDQNKIVIKNIEDNPIVELTNGTGTKDDPYLISNEEDWKKASATSTTSDTYFKLTKDLDFSNKKFYMLGSKNTEFKGTLDGNGKKISNLSINVPKVAGFDYVGIIGKGGSAYGINLNNIKVTGYNYVGALFGSTRGTVRDIYASNLNVSGNNYIGGIGGDINTNSPRPTSMIISANVEGNSYVGITTGSSYLGIEQIAIIGGSATGNSYVGRLSGSAVSWHDTYALETIPNGNGGKDCWKTIPSDANLSDLSIYKNMNIDTSLTGDTDGVGYYFDVDKNGNIFVTK